MFYYYIILAVVLCFKFLFSFCACGLQARESWGKSQEMHFKRLQHLLEKSNIYSKFLLTKMEQQQQEVGFYVVFGGGGNGPTRHPQDVLMNYS